MQSNQSASSTKSEFDRQVERMLGNWESSVRDRGVAAIKKAELRRVYERVGPARFAAGVQAALDGHHTGFFPPIDVFQDFVPDHVVPEGKRTCPMCCRTPQGMVLRESVHPESGKRYMAYRSCTHDEPSYTDYRSGREEEIA